MASTDWTLLVNSLDAPSVARGVTYGIARPPGGGNFLFGFNSKVTDAGVVGYYTNQVNFAPMAKGGSIRAAIQRGVSGGPTSFAPFIYLCLQGNAVEDLGYLLGLSDEDPHRIVLRKGRPTEGLPAVAPGSSGILRRSVETIVPGTFKHLRLDAIREPGGDVILRVLQNDLTAPGASVATPVWEAVPGMADFVDDALGINSGSAPYTSGYAGFAFQVHDVTRRGFFDHIEVQRQLTP